MHLTIEFKGIQEKIIQAAVDYGLAKTKSNLLTHSKGSS